MANKYAIVRPMDTPTTPAYDSTDDTRKHISRVQDLMTEQRERIRLRSFVHDDSKLQEPEKSIFDLVTPQLKALTYGSKEYRESLNGMKIALDHHYQHNSHHPEHFANGIRGMSLFDILEMLADWKAAGERHADGSLVRSFTINRARYNIDPNTYGNLINTALELGWLTTAEGHELFAAVSRL